MRKTSPLRYDLNPDRIERSRGHTPQPSIVVVRWSRVFREAALPLNREWLGDRILQTGRALHWDLRCLSHIIDDTAVL
jgi:hypothetical protein